MTRTHPTGIASVDDDIGGLPAGALVQVHGPSAAGKSSLALVLARSCGPAALVLPEQPHPARMAAILGERARGCLVARPSSLEDQTRAVTGAARLLSEGRVLCVVLDSLTYLYRFEHLSSLEAYRSLLSQLRALRAAVRASGGLAIFTNQVRGGPQGPVALGGPPVAHASDLILGLDVLDGPWRRLRLEKHPFQPAGRAWDVRLGAGGLE